ncbi:MAG: SDR family oxidoreductase [Acidimicrobiia bacterium]|nr:SDR family oxidoreductase [Acidimicrobiia bacterium]
MTGRPNQRDRSEQSRIWERALITGASAGIGEAFARLLADQGTDLVIVARRTDRLEALADELTARPNPIQVEILTADLSDRDDLDRVMTRLRTPAQPIDLLVNNAGFGTVGDFLDQDPGREATMIDVNIGAVHRLAHAAGSAMADRGGGGILNVSSIAGFTPSPKSATYGATKAFVTSFSEALAVELGPRGVVVSCLCPGLTRTEFQEKAEYRPSALPGFFWQSAEDVAAAGLAGLAAGRIRVVPGVHNRVATGLARTTPGGVVRRVSKLLARANGK